MASRPLTELQADADAAAVKWARGMQDFQAGAISPAEFGKLTRRMRRAEKAFQEAKTLSRMSAA